jgi:pimeloyl-ACP methyl ester carboxylesterase/DNA-binding SARP family transcriptional activator
MATGERAPALALTLLGPIALARDGEDVPLPASRKTRALLGYLAASDRPVRRDRLCELLWEVPDDPRGALRWSLSKLRGLIGEDACLRADRDAVQLDCARLTVDWRTLRDISAQDIRKIAADTLFEAQCLDGHFLEGLDLPRCDVFQAWLVAMREDARRWRVALLRELSERPIDPARGLELARAWVALDPYDALARVALIDRLEQAGRHNEAEQQRGLGVRKLDEGEVAVPPALRTTPTPPPTAGKPTALPPQHIRFCTASDGTGLAYSVVGQGPPVVKTANWLNHLEYDWDSPIWRHWIDAIAADHRLLRYDQRGNGLSDWNVGSLTLDAFVDDLASVVDAAGLEQFDLLGVSQGCSIAIAYCARYPARVRRLILFGGYAAGWRTRAIPAELARREAMLTLTETGWGQNNPAFRQMFTTLFFPDASAEEADWFNELQRRTTSPENAVRLQEAFGVIDVRDLLKDVRKPTLVIHARDDAVIPLSSGRALAAAIPGAEFVTLETRNHLPLEHEAAWPVLINRLRSFLS